MSKEGLQEAAGDAVEMATDQEVENLLIGFMDALVLEQKKAYGFTHSFAQVIRSAPEPVAPALQEVAP